VAENSSFFSGADFTLLIALLTAFGKNYAKLTENVETLT